MIKGYPQGLKVGDFIQLDTHFKDIWFEVISTYPPTDRSDFWIINYVTYDKYSYSPRKEWCNSASTIRRYLPSEMAIPVILFKRHRFYSMIGRYDPFTGFIPVNRIYDNGRKNAGPRTRAGLYAES